MFDNEVRSQVEVAGAWSSRLCGGRGLALNELGRGEGGLWALWMRGIGLWRLLRLLLKIFVGNKTSLASLPECGRRREGIWGCIASWWLRCCVGVEESRVWTAREGYCRGGGAELFSQNLIEEFCCKSYVYLLFSSLRRFRISFRVLVDHEVSPFSPAPAESIKKSENNTKSLTPLTLPL